MEIYLIWPHWEEGQRDPENSTPAKSILGFWSELKGQGYVYASSLVKVWSHPLLSNPYVGF